MASDATRWTAMSDMTAPSSRLDARYHLFRCQFRNCLVLRQSVSRTVRLIVGVAPLPRPSLVALGYLLLLSILLIMPPSQSAAVTLSRNNTLFAAEESGKNAVPSDSEAVRCEELDADERYAEGVYCPATWDSLYCWPPTAAGATASRLCTEIFAFEGVPLAKAAFEKAAFAYRICSHDGQWLWGNWTNYTECLELIEDTGRPVSIPTIVGHILFIGSLISLVTLIITLTIFQYFKSLQCPRTRVHKNLVAALIIHSVLLATISSSIVLQGEVSLHTQIDFICKSVVALDIYAAMASINWMFVEGLLLHSRLSFSVFQDEPPFKLYHFIGWGLPCIFVSAWVIATTLNVHTPCWEGYGKSKFVWIVTGPMLLALLVNAIFLINIVHVLVTKLRSSVSMETAQVRKSIKATALLFPLLGITHLLFCINPQDDKYLEDAYMITNAVLQSSQGLFVSVLYCFLNSEVQGVLKNAYQRNAVRRSSCYTRSRGMSQVSTSLSHFHETTCVKMAPSLKKVIILPLQGSRRTSSRECSSEPPPAEDCTKLSPLLTKKDATADNGNAAVSSES